MTRGYSIIGLDNPKDKSNLGSVMRGVGCYDAQHVYYTGSRVKFGSVATDTQKQYRHTPITNVNNLLDVIPYDCVPIAVDLLDSATPIQDFHHPERAFYIFGQEDGTLGKRITDGCAKSVFIPTKYCMNLAVTVNVILFDRMIKRKEFNQPPTKTTNQ